MMSVNKVLLIGNLTADPELKVTPNGSAVCEFTIALNRQYKAKENQERKEEVAFVDVVTWGRTAEVCAEFLKKGRPTFVEGRLTQSRWESPEGKKMSRLRVTAESVQFLNAGRPQEIHEPAPAEH